MCLDALVLRLTGDAGPFTDLGFIPTTGLTQGVPLFDEGGLGLRVAPNLGFRNRTGNGGIARPLQEGTCGLCVCATNANA